MTLSSEARAMLAEDARIERCALECWDEERRAAFDRDFESDDEATADAQALFEWAMGIRP